MENVMPPVTPGFKGLFACQYDQRFSYFVYVPQSLVDDSEKPSTLAVFIHGTGRNAEYFLKDFRDFAEENRVLLVAPLFPGGIIEPNSNFNYQFIKFHDIRFDQILLAMVDEIADTYDVPRDRFLLHGFSGGGQFVHRFLYLHPDRLWAASVGAPGIVTYLEPTKPWPLGISHAEELFGAPIRLDDIRKVPVQLIVGSEDLENMKVNENSPYWVKGIDLYGITRVDKLRALRDNFEREGIVVQYEEVPGVKHEGEKIVKNVAAFFASIH
jgi:predicted esterase